MIIDIHSHLNDPKFSADLEEVIERMREAGVATITVGTDKEYSTRAVEIAEKYNMWATVGLHPSDDLGAVWDYKFYKKLVKNERVVAIGECGLDYYRIQDTGERVEEEKERQKEVFKSQIELALELDKPLMLHIRNAYSDALEVLGHYPECRGNVHFFTAGYKVARKFWDLGFTTSFCGLITYLPDFDDLIRKAPEDMFMVETDAPYVPPDPYRGQRNEPIYVKEVIKRIAELRGSTPDHIAEITTQTARRVFGLFA